MMIAADFYQRKVIFKLNLESWSPFHQNGGALYRIQFPLFYFLSIGQLGECYHLNERKTIKNGICVTEVSAKMYEISKDLIN